MTKVSCLYPQTRTILRTADQRAAAWKAAAATSAEIAPVMAAATKVPATR